jgi:hypothetical protein
MDNFDLQKFLKDSKALENLNPTLKSINESTDDLKAKIKKMIVAELEGADLEDATKRAEKGDSTDLALHMAGVKEETDVDLEDPLMEENIDEDLEEAKKKKDEEVEDIDVTDTEDISTEDIPAEDEMPTEDAPEDTGGLKDIAADMKGTEADLMDHLMKSFQIAKGMGNEKLETQVGNTLKFFVSEYIGGGEQ